MRSEWQDISWQARLHPIRWLHVGCWADIHSTAHFNYLNSQLTSIIRGWRQEKYLLTGGSVACDILREVVLCRRWDSALTRPSHRKRWCTAGKLCLYINSGPSCFDNWVVVKVVSNKTDKERADVRGCCKGHQWNLQCCNKFNCWLSFILENNKRNTQTRGLEICGNDFMVSQLERVEHLCPKVKWSTLPYL